MDVVESDFWVGYIRLITTSRVALWYFIYIFVFSLVILSAINKMLVGAERLFANYKSGALILFKVINHSFHYRGIVYFS